MGMEKAPAHSHDQPLDLFATTLTVLLCAIWGGAFVGIKINTLDMPPLGAGALRFCLVAVVLVGWARYRHVSLQVDSTEAKSLVLPVLLSCYTNFIAYVGTALTTSGRATVFFYTQPIFLALLAPYFLPGDHLTVRKLCGLGLALCGVIALF